MPPQGQQYQNQQAPTGQPVGPAMTPQPGQGLPSMPPSPQPLPQPVTGGPGAAAATPKSNPNSTQNALLISEIRDGMVIVNDGSMRTVVACQSINFDLMSDREREAVEFSYQQFLNSLYFPI